MAGLPGRLRFEPEAEEIDEGVVAPVGVMRRWMPVSQFERDESVECAADGAGAVDGIFIAQIEATERHGKNLDNPFNRRFQFGVAGHWESIG